MRIVLLLCCCLALLGAVLTAFAAVGPPFELLSHFRPGFAGLALLVAVITAIRDWRLSIPAFMAAGLFVFQISGTSWREINPSADGHEITIAWANIHRSTDAAEGFAAFVGEKQPDVIAIGEPDDLTSTDLAKLFPQYPYILKAEAWYQPKVIILSIYPVKDEKIHESIPYR